MSQPKRYEVETLNCCFDAEMVESEQGEYVLYSDYAALIAEVEHLKTRPTLANQYSEYAAIAAENERLKFEVECRKRSYDFMKNEASHRMSEVLRLENENEVLQASLRHYVYQDGLRKAGEAIHQQRIESGSYNREKNETIKRLAAENERLRKAGDAMADTRNKPITLSEFGHLAMAWDEAKNGGSK